MEIKKEDVRAIRAGYYTITYSPAKDNDSHPCIKIESQCKWNWLTVNEIRSLIETLKRVEETCKE